MKTMQKKRRPLTFRTVWSALMETRANIEKISQEVGRVSQEVGRVSQEVGRVSQEVGRV